MARKRDGDNGLSEQEIRDALKRGPYAWPGGYPVYFLTSDGEALCFKSVEKNLDLVLEASREGDNTGGWMVVGLEVNWEDPDLYCSDTNERIPSAYAED